MLPSIQCKFRQSLWKSVMAMSSMAHCKSKSQSHYWKPFWWTRRDKTSQPKSTLTPARSDQVKNLTSNLLFLEQFLNYPSQIIENLRLALFCAYIVIVFLFCVQMKCQLLMLTLVRLNYVCQMTSKVCGRDRLRHTSSMNGDSSLISYVCKCILKVHWL